MLGNQATINVVQDTCYKYGGHKKRSAYGEPESLQYDEFANMAVECLERSRTGY